VPGVFLSAAQKVITLGAPRVENRGGVSRATADVDGIPLWFESADIELSASAEAFASALLFSSVHRHRALVAQTPLSDVWLDNVEEIMSAWQEWWGYTPIPPIAERRPDAGGSNAASALMFSGGVDSFHTLLCGPKPDFLVSVHGFDIPLDDSRRMDELRLVLRESAEACGVRPVVIRTNLREHPSAGRPSLWERSHGGGIAAIGHLLSDHIGKLSVSASWFLPDQQPWGSHTLTDPLFSANGLVIDHVGWDVKREDKVDAIAKNDVVQKHLRVCYKNVDTAVNCSRCEKCVVAMLHLMENGVLDQCGTFDGSDLAARVRALPFVHYYYNISTRILARGRLDPSVQRELSKVLARSRRALPFLKIRSRLQQAVGQYL
jgi:hypothetical protein